MNDRPVGETARTKIWRAIETGEDITLDEAERATVVNELRLWMQDGQVDAELAGTRLDEESA
jgi:hypothetical protein